MSLTVHQRAEIIQRQTGCTRDEAFRRARIADGAARDAADRAARVQAATAGTAQRTQQSLSVSHHVQQTTDNFGIGFLSGALVGHVATRNMDCSESTVARDTGSSDSGSSCDSGGGGDF